MDTNAKKGKAPKYPCLRCRKAVEKDQRSFQCQTCQLWVHTECENISDELFKILADSENYGGVLELHQLPGQHSQIGEACHSTGEQGEGGGDSDDQDNQ